MGSPLTASLLAFAIALAASAASASDYILDISGSPALLVKVKCAVVGPDDVSRVIKFQGFVPAKYLLEHDAVSCTVQKWDAQGRLRVALLDDSIVIAWAETAAAYNYVRVRSDGPWGEAAGVRGNIAFRRAHMNPPSSLNRGLPPPLNPPLTPPLLP